MANEQQQAQSKQLLDAIQQMLTGAGEVAGVKPQGAGAPPLTAAPGVVPPSPTPNITFNPTGAPNAPLPTAAPAPVRPTPQTGSQSIGDFRSKNAATNAGMVSLGNSLGNLFASVGQKEHDKKALMAQNYMEQISGLLSSGDPKDREKAQMFLDDPKIRKVLKTGLEYVPLEEEVPPEAQGVQTALQKMTQGGQPPKPQMRAVLPQPSQAQQIQGAGSNALLQMIQKDPAKALTLMGASTLSSSEQHATEFFQAGLGFSPTQVGAMTQQEKLAGLRMYESVVKDAMRAQTEIYKADVNYKGKIDTASILAKSKERIADGVNSAKNKKGMSAVYAANARVYAGMARDFLGIVKSGKDKNGNPLSDTQKKYYEDQAKMYQQKADDLLSQQGDEDLWNMFMKAQAVGGGDEDDTEE